MKLDELTEVLLREALITHPDLLVALREVEEGVVLDVFEPWTGTSRRDGREAA